MAIAGLVKEGVCYLVIIARMATGDGLFQLSSHRHQANALVKQ